MDGYSVEEAGQVPLLFDETVVCHEDEAEDETVVLEVSVVDEDYVWFDEVDKSEDYWDF